MRTGFRQGLRQRGQALIWLLGTMAAAAAVMYGIFNVAQINSAKQKTVNGADAAALAGATVQARMLNLVAYNNRSIMANEAFLIQMLSVESWLGYFKTTANNFGTVADIVGIFIPPVEAIGKFLDETADIADQIRKDVVKPANNAIIKALELSKDGLFFAHGVVLGGGALVAENAAIKLVQANRSNFGTHEDNGLLVDNSPAVRALTFALNEKEWNGFTKRYQANDRGDAKEVLLGSRDGFSTNRPGQPWFNINAGFAGTEKLGGSQLQGYDRWETQDTFELWEKVPCKSGLCKEYQPIGWGRANADDNGNSGGVWSPNRSAQKLAYEDGMDYSHKGWSGVPAVYDVADKKKEDRASLELDFLVAVRRPQANTLTTSQMNVSVANDTVVGSSEMNENLEGNQLSALSKARVYFERPQRGLANDKTGTALWRPDGAKEYGSLFSPYWQARLTDLTAKEKAALLGAMGINPLYAPLTPGGQK
jgi:hypothetical protein